MFLRRQSPSLIREHSGLGALISSPPQVARHSSEFDRNAYATATEDTEREDSSPMPEDARNFAAQSSFRSARRDYATSEAAGATDSINDAAKLIRTLLDDPALFFTVDQKESYKIRLRK
ncbi:uncharacterized protein BKA78DRAFT_384209 [Phyllosticta capitalensis]|uniref:uncharacterized protein n=1 Tax=Phyllosticta capitalensis TaxID=121624 RepID=UPI003130288C